MDVALVSQSSVDRGGHGLKESAAKVQATARQSHCDIEVTAVGDEAHLPLNLDDIIRTSQVHMQVLFHLRAK